MSIDYRNLMPLLRITSIAGAWIGVLFGLVFVFPMQTCRRLWFLLALSLAAAPTAVRAGEKLTDARRLLLTGKYAEALAAYEQLAAAEPVAAAVGIARSRAAIGEADEAEAVLKQALSAHPAAELHAELARLAFDRGDYPTAAEQVAAALKLDARSLPARWFEAELDRTAGRLDEADKGYKWFVDYYNDNDAHSAESLHYIGLAAAQFARWHRLSNQFSFLVNELYPEALKQDENYWPAHYEAGMLFLEKYNEAEAAREFQAALAINANAAEIHAAMARLALQSFQIEQARRSLARAAEINPRLAAVYQLRADADFANFQLADAIAALEEGRKLNPVAEATLGRLAAACLVVDGTEHDGPDSRFGKLASEAEARNPHAGEFFLSLAAALDLCRRFPAAARFYGQAVEIMPQLTSARGELGLMYMRLGQEAEARKLLEESFEVDPFNVRVSNSLKVLEVLEGYAVLETDHFVLKFDRGQDELLARYAARYLESEVYPALVKRYAFVPEGKSLFEIFSRARNTNGHGWFSARMVGLPYVGTVGACAGKMVAMASPNDLDKKFNWARVLKHEFVHVLNLQQTNFGIPHWFTEALAVETEGYPRPQIWNDLLAERVPKGELFNLDDINLGFVRPKSGLDWQMAYCQAQLYAQFMLAAYGDDALAKMLAAYAGNLDTRAALARSFGVEQEEFEKGYLEHLRKVVAGLSKQPKPVELSMAQLQRAHEADPENPDLTARLAKAYLDRKDYPQARKLAAQATKLKPKHALAGYVLARVHLVVGETDEAIELLDACLDREAPQENVLNLLASLRFKAKQYDKAAELYRLGAEHNPSQVQWTKSLLRVYLTTGDRAKLRPLLVQLADADYDDAKVRKKLAQLALEDKDFAAAVDWANQANQIDVMDAEVHRLWGDGLRGLNDLAAAAEELETAVRLDPEEPAHRLALAEVYAGAKQAEKARRAIAGLLKLAPDYPGAKELLEKLAP